MSKLTIKPATEANRDELEQLISVCYSEVYPGWYEEDVLIDALPAMLRVDAKLLESGRYLSAYKGKKLAGCGGWSTMEPGSGNMQSGIGHIRHFATHPDFMRQGVGSAILNACITAATEEGLERLQCFSSLAAEDFYNRHGFEPKQEVTIMLGENIPFPAILMERQLP